MTMRPVTYESPLQIGALISTAGHFSDVYEGTDPVQGRVAVKICKPLLGESNDAFNHRQEQLLTEAQNLKRASHPNIVKVHQVLTGSDGKVVMVTEFCGGGSVGQVARSGPPTLTFARRVLTHVASGLQCVHKEEMLHRDVKPDNILLDDQGNAKLGDFGLVTDAIIHGLANQAAYLAHVPPEFWDPNRPEHRKTSRLSDVWAYGATAYRLVNGDSLWNMFGGSSSAARLVRNQRFATQLAWLPHVPVGWRQFIKKCLHDDPSKRYQNAEDLHQALARVEVSPEWNCVQRVNSYRWTRTKGTRTIDVTWTNNGAIDNSWHATSSPANGNGITRTLGKSNGWVTYSDAISGLEKFFTGST